MKMPSSSLQPQESPLQGQHHKPNLSLISLGVLLVVTFFTALYMRSLNSGIPYYYDSLGYSATIGGTFVATFTLASTAMRLIGGQITDKFPHYTVLIVSLGGLLLGVAIPMLWDAFWVVMASRVLQGASFALATNVMTVAVMSSAPKEHIGRRVGIKGVGTSLGTMLGAASATWLLDGFGFKEFFGFYVILMVISIIAVLLLKRADDKASKVNSQRGVSTDSQATSQRYAAPVSSHPDTASIVSAENNTTPSGAIRDISPGTSPKEPPSAAETKTKRHIKELIAPYLFPQVMPYLAISFAQRMPQGFCIAFILIFAKFEGIAAGATFFVAAGAITLLFRLLGGNLFDSGKNWLLFPILCIEVFGFAALAIHPSMITLIIAALGYGLSVGGSSPFLKTIGAKSTPKEHWGVVNGELYFFGDIGKSVGAFFGGLAIDLLGKAFVPEVALAVALITALITGVALLIGKHITPATQQQ